MKTAEPADALADFDLTQVFEAFLRRRWIIAGSLAVSFTGALAYLLTAQPRYTATTLLLIEKEAGHAYNEGPKAEMAADDYYQTQYKLLKSRSLIAKVHRELELGKTEDFARGPSALAAEVTIAPLPRTRLVNVNVSSRSPELAARIANALAQRYVADNLENKLFISREILQTLYPGQRPPERGATIAPANYHALPSVVNNPLILALKTSLAELEVRMGELERRYTPEHPVRARLAAEIAASRGRIEQETRRIVEGMRLELSGQLLGNNVRVVDPAEPPRAPSKPQRGRTLGLAALIGLVAGAVLALLVDSMDQSIYSQEDVERKLGLPFLGSITKASLNSGPGDTAANYQEMLTSPDSFTGEALKNIRTMIGFAGAGKELKRLLVTSTSQSEGKTFVAINLALVFAQLGERILLIEGDLRRPNLHKRFRVSNERGLSNFLAHGKDVSELPLLIQDTAIANLQTLVCGPIPPNPAELLSTPRVKALLAWASERYDHFLIDGTPVFPITDALLWANYVDAAVYVVKFGAVHAKAAARAKQKLEESGMKIAGVVVNQVTRKTGAYYGDYYYQYRYSENGDGRPRKADGKRAQA